MLVEVQERDWHGVRRRDGLLIRQVEHGIWAVRPITGNEIDSCPCCDRHLRTMRAAKLLADTMFPIGSASWT